jgi:hypothetical protein
VSEELGEFHRAASRRRNGSASTGSGNGRRRVPEPVFAGAGIPQPRVVLSGATTSYKMDYSKMLPLHIVQGTDRDDSHTRGAVTEDALSASSVSMSRARAGVRREAGCPAERARVPGPGPGLDGHLLFKAEVLIKRSRRRRQHGQPARLLRPNILPSLFPHRPVLAYRFHDEKQEAGEVLARHRHAGCVTTASMDLCVLSAPSSTSNDPEWPLRTYQPQARRPSSCSAPKVSVAGRPSIRSCRTVASSSGSKVAEQSCAQRQGPQLLDHRAVES